MGRSDQGSSPGGKASSFRRAHGGNGIFASIGARKLGSTRSFSFSRIWAACDLRRRAEGLPHVRGQFEGAASADGPDARVLDDREG